MQRPKIPALVAAEIVPGSNTEQRIDLREMLRRIELHTISILALGDLIEMVPFRSALRAWRRSATRNHEARGRRAPRHAHCLVVVIGLGLGKRKAAVLLDGFHAQAAVAADARKNNCCCPFALVRG